MPEKLSKDEVKIRLREAYYQEKSVTLRYHEIANVKFGELPYKMLIVTVEEIRDNEVLIRVNSNVVSIALTENVGVETH